MSNFRHRIVQLDAHRHVLVRQNIYSQNWYCGEVPGQTAREAASYAAKQNLTAVHSELDDAVRALLTAYPEMAHSLSEITFEPARGGLEPLRLVTIHLRTFQQQRYCEPLPV